MSEVTLTAASGRAVGSSDSRRLRREGSIPAVVYGMGSDPRSIQVKYGDFRAAMSTDAGVNALIRLEIDGESDFTLVTDLQRDPVRRDVTHIDFLRIDPHKVMTLDVPIVIVGEAKELAAAGGITDQVLMSLSVSVRPDSIPTDIKADITHMDLDSTLTVGDLQLPKGVETDVDPADPVVSASLPRAALEPEAEEGEGEEGEEGAEGEEGEEGSEGEGGDDSGDGDGDDS